MVQPKRKPSPLSCATHDRIWLMSWWSATPQNTELFHHAVDRGSPKVVCNAPPAVIFPLRKAETDFAVLPFSFPFLREKVLFPLQQGQQFTLFAISLLLAQLTILTTRPVLQRKNMLFSSSGLMTWMGSNIPSRMQVIEGDVIPSCFGYCTQIHVSMYSYIYIQICTFIQCGLFWPVVLFEEIGWWIFREFRATFAPTPEKSCFCKGFLAKWPAKFWGFESLEENLARFKKKCQKLPATISLLQSNKPKEHETQTVSVSWLGFVIWYLSVNLRSQCCIAAQL